MSTKKAVFKPGQSAKKSAACPSMDDMENVGGASGRSGSAKKKTLAQQIAELSNPTPKDFDPEDEEHAGMTSTSRISHDYDDMDDEQDTPKLLSERSHIRKNFDVEDVSEEYKGRVISRKSLQAFSDDSDADGQEEGEDDEEEDEEDAEEDGEDEDGEDEEADEDGMEMVEDDEEQSGEEDDEEEGSDAEGSKSMLASGLSAQQRRVQQQLALLEEEDESAGTSLFAPRGAAAAAAAVTSSTATSQYTKSLHMKHQLAWYTNLLNLRIRVQGVLASANRLPAAVAVAGDDNDAGADSDSTQPANVRAQFESASPAVAPAYSSALRGARKLLDELFELQHGLMAQNTKIFASASSSAHDDDEDDEQPSQQDGTAHIPQWQGVSGSRKRKRDAADDEAETEAADEEDEEAEGEEDSAESTEATLHAYWSYLNDELNPFFTPIQNALIDKWNTKTQLSAGQIAGAAGSGSAFGASGLASSKGGLKVINQSVLSQIEQLMIDEERLIKRSQLHRAAPATSSGAAASGSELLGRVAAERERVSKAARTAGQSHNDAVDSALMGEDADASLLSGRYAEVYDAAIYDDNDYYQQLLAEIISAASAAAIDGGAAGGHDGDLLAKAAAAARRKGRKAGAMVDRRASKGRKLRYTVHAKLANFMAPRPAPITDDYAARAAQDQTRSSSLLTGSGFAMDELFMNLFGGQGKVAKIATTA